MRASRQDNQAKINPDAFEIKGLSAFRALYPQGSNLLVCPFVKVPYIMKKGAFEIRVCNTGDL